MSNIILVMGESGSGKTSAMRTLNPEETFLISVINKDLPFKGWKNQYTLMPVPETGKKNNRKIIYERMFSANTYKEDKALFANAVETITNALEGISIKRPDIKTIIIDDSQYIMAYELLSRAKEKGFDKFNELAQNFFAVITKAQSLRSDIDVFFLHHTEVTNESKKKAKTAGKMLDNMVTVEGLFTIVLMADSRKVNNQLEYFFITNSDGTNTCKSPMGMFPSEIPNDLQIVKNKIKSYNEGIE